MAYDRVRGAHALADRAVRHHLWAERLIHNYEAAYRYMAAARGEIDE